MARPARTGASLLRVDGRDGRAADCGPDRTGAVRRDGRGGGYCPARAAVAAGVRQWRARRSPGRADPPFGGCSRPGFGPVGAGAGIRGPGRAARSDPVAARSRADRFQHRSCRPVARRPRHRAGGGELDAVARARSRQSGICHNQRCGAAGPGGRPAAAWRHGAGPVDRTGGLCAVACPCPDTCGAGAYGSRAAVRATVAARGVAAGCGHDDPGRTPPQRLCRIHGRPETGQGARGAGPLRRGIHRAERRDPPQWAGLCRHADAQRAGLSGDHRSGRRAVAAGGNRLAAHGTSGAVGAAGAAGAPAWPGSQSGARRAEPRPDAASS